MVVKLQKYCCGMVFLDCPTNAQTAHQAGGRVMRIGQTKFHHISTVNCLRDDEVKWDGGIDTISRRYIWIIILDHRYDLSLQTNAVCKKMFYRRRSRKHYRHRPGHEGQTIDIDGKKTV